MWRRNRTSRLPRHGCNLARGWPVRHWQATFGRVYFPLFMRVAFSCALLALGFSSCQKTENPLCGLPIFAHQVYYDIVDANTGQDWFATAGRTSGDSLQLLASEQGAAQRAVRRGSGFRLGPISVFNNAQSTITHYLRFSARDVDTVVTRLRFGPVQHGPCEDFAPLTEVEITYNGRPNTLLRADVPADSLSRYERGGQGKVIKLRKRP